MNNTATQTALAPRTRATKTAPAKATPKATPKAPARCWVLDPDLLGTGRKPRKLEVRRGMGPERLLTEPRGPLGVWTARLYEPERNSRGIPATWEEAAIGFSRWCGVKCGDALGAAFVDSLGQHPATEVVLAFVVGLEAWHALGTPTPAQLTDNVRALADAFHVAENDHWTSPRVIERTRRAADARGPLAAAARAALDRLATRRLRVAEENMAAQARVADTLAAPIEELLAGFERCVRHVQDHAARFDQIRHDLAAARAAIRGHAGEEPAAPPAALAQPSLDDGDAPDHEPAAVELSTPPPAIRKTHKARRPK